LDTVSPPRSRTRRHLIVGRRRHIPLHPGHFSLPHLHACLGYLSARQLRSTLPRKPLPMGKGSLVRRRVEAEPRSCRAPYSLFHHIPTSLPHLTSPPTNHNKPQKRNSEPITNPPQKKNHRNQKPHRPSRRQKTRRQNTNPLLPTPIPSPSLKHGRKTRRRRTKQPRVPKETLVNTM
jgi:hypothetical protein